MEVRICLPIVNSVAREQQDDLHFGINFTLPGVIYRGIVPITVLGKDRAEYPAKIVVEGPETEFGFKVPEQPREVTLNKYGELLAYDVIMEN